MKKILPILLAAMLLAIPITGCSSDEEEKEPENQQEETPVEDETPEIVANIIQFDEVQTGMPVAKIKTTMGDIEIMLFPEQAPKAVENFVTHSQNGYYNGITFHRVIDGFMIQGGDPTGTGMGGESIYKDEAGNPATFKDEFSNDLYMFRGALAMANSGANTNSSQFFIVQSPEIYAAKKEDLLGAGWPSNAVDKYEEVGGTPHLDQIHTVFGQVISGMEVVDEIIKVETTGGEENKPVEDVLINSIEITYPKGGDPKVEGEGETPSTKPETEAPATPPATETPATETPAA